MPKIHLRLSVELDVTDEQMQKLADIYNDYYDIELRQLENIGADISKAVPCDWDDGGYYPGPWFETDVEKWRSKHE